jgi:hypothetical protein
VATHGVPIGRTVVSSPAHSAFSTPTEFVGFIAALRKLSGGKPIRFKLCVGARTEFLSICKAILASGIAPDVAIVDGGTGADFTLSARAMMFAVGCIQALKCNTHCREADGTRGALPPWPMPLRLQRLTRGARPPPIHRTYERIYSRQTTPRPRVDSSEMRAKGLFVASLKMRACGVPI